MRLEVNDVLLYSDVFGIESILDQYSQTLIYGTPNFDFEEDY